MSTYAINHNEIIERHPELFEADKAPSLLSCVIWSLFVSLVAAICAVVMFAPAILSSIR